MPIRRFWLLSKNIDRINAEADLRAIQIATAVQSTDNYNAVIERLKRQMGSIATYQEEAPRFDDAGAGAFSALRNMGTWG